MMTKITEEKNLYTFSKDGNECTILDARTPRYWYNYLWNENRYCTKISQIGHGCSYYLNNKADMCMINRDEARYIYLRDDDTKACWNIGEGPLNTKVTEYQCTHSIGYTCISSKYNGIRGSWKLFVPTDGYNEVWTLQLQNESNTIKHISIFSAVNYYLEGFSYPRYYEMYRCMHTSFDKELNGVYCQSKHPFAPHTRYNAYIASSEPVYAYDGDLTAFCGSTSTVTQTDASTSALFQCPDIVVKGKDCTNSNAALFVLGGVLQHKINLFPNETKEIYFVFGISESLEEARYTVGKYSNSKAVKDALKKTQDYYFEKYSRLSIKTPDEKINCIMNNWVKKQIDFCIVGKKGVRDNLQIAAALLNYRPEKAKEEILECLRHQFSDGHAVLTWYPYDDTRYSDQPFWIIWAICRLIKETGDFSILEEPISWQDGGTATVQDHVYAAINRLILDKGKNGLIRIYFADWNDALNITTDPEAESVMLSQQFCLALLEWKNLMIAIGNYTYADELENDYNTLKNSINKHAWDGKWYMRALSTVENIGSKDSTGSKIYLNTQTWSILANIPDHDRRLEVLKAIDTMEHDFGFPLNLPPYTEYTPNVGRMSGMLPGLFENGGVYCHASAFKILADCRCGRAQNALRTLKKIMPDSEENPSSQSGAEPYVFTNCYSTCLDYYGKSYQSWTTGTSAWCMIGLYEGILGIQSEYAGLKINPCFPGIWEGAETTRWFRNATYHITFKNPDHIDNGLAVIFADGIQVSGCVLPDFRDESIHEIEVILKNNI